MKRRFSLVLAAVAFSAAVAGWRLEAQPPPSATAPAATPGRLPQDPAAVLRRAGQVVSNHHLQRPVLNNEFGRRMAEALVEQLDFEHVLLCQAEVHQLLALAPKLDDSVRSGELELFKDALQIRDRARGRALEWMRAALAIPPDFHRLEWQPCDLASMPHAMTEEDLRLLWGMKLCAELEDVMIQDSLSQEEALAALRERYERELGPEAAATQPPKLLQLALDVFCAALDPHSSYLDSSAREIYDQHLQARGPASLGLRLRTMADGHLEVVSLQEGSLSKGLVHPGDIIVSLADAAARCNFQGMTLAEAQARLSGPEGPCRLVILRQGELLGVDVQRAVLPDERERVSSLLWRTPSGQLVGLCRLPSFYVGSEGLVSSADDVAAALRQLESQGASALVLDLRGNNGGSLPEALKLAGNLAPGQPLIQQTGQELVIHMAKTRAILIQAPLVLLVDSRTASAAEVFAAGLQDLHRAVVCGCDDTYGKGTVQKLIDMEPLLPGMERVGRLKLTIGAFIRLNGQPLQGTGVQPQIKWPAYDQVMKSALKYGESFQYRPLQVSPGAVTDHPVDLRVQAIVPSLIQRMKCREAEFPVLQSIEMDMLALQQQLRRPALPLDLEERRSLAASDAQDAARRRALMVEQGLMAGGDADLPRNHIGPDLYQRLAALTAVELAGLILNPDYEPEAAAAE